MLEKKIEKLLSFTPSINRLNNNGGNHSNTTSTVNASSSRYGFDYEKKAKRSSKGFYPLLTESLSPTPIKKPVKSMNFTEGKASSLTNNNAQQSRKQNISDLPKLLIDSSQNNSVSRGKKLKPNSFLNSNSFGSREISLSNTNANTYVNTENNVKIKNMKSSVKPMQYQMSNLLRFKNISKELQSSSLKDNTMFRSHKKKPQFSMEFSNGKKMNSERKDQIYSPSFIPKIKDRSNILSMLSDDFQTTTEKKESQVLLSPISKNNNSKSSFISKNQDNLFRKKIAESKISLKRGPKKKLEIQTILGGMKNKSKIIEDLRPGKVEMDYDKYEQAVQQNKEIITTERERIIDSEFEEKPSDLEEDNTRINNALSIDKLNFIQSFKDLKDRYTKKFPPLKPVPNPYEPIEDTLKNYYTDLTSVENINNNEVEEMKADYPIIHECFHNKIQFYIIDEHFTFYILKKYFDCFNELLQTFVDCSRVQFDKLSHSFDLKRRLSFRGNQPSIPKNEVGKIEELRKIYEDFEPENQNFIQNLVMMSSKNWFSKQNKLEETEASDKKKLKLRKKASILLKSGTLQKSISLKTGTLSRQVTNAFKYRRISQKIKNFNCFAEKHNLEKNDPNKKEDKKEDSESEKNAFRRTNKRMQTIADKDLTPEKIWQLLTNDIFYNKKSHFIDLYIRNIGKFDINKQDEKGNTLLIYATQSNCVGICEFLLQRGSDPNKANETGNTALHYSISHKFFEISNLLIKYEANEKAKNDFGLNPWECLNKDCEAGV